MPSREPGTARVQIAEGAFYTIYATGAGTVERVSKRPASGLEEVRILRAVEHPFVNRMVSWAVEEGWLKFEMERCECCLSDRAELDELLSRIVDGDELMDGEDELMDVDERTVDVAAVKRVKLESTGGDASGGDTCVADQISDLITDPITDIENYLTPSTEISTLNPSDTLNPPDPINPSDNTILDPFSNSLVPCSTSVIISDSSSSTEYNTPTVPLKTHHWIKLMMRQVSSALAHVHSKHVVHMDIKPENILIRLSRGQLVFQLCDFNIAQVGEGPFSLDGDKVYMAPEILNGRCFYKSDVFSLGLVYLELVNEAALPRSGAAYRKLRRNNFEGWRIDEIGRRMLERDVKVRCSSKEVAEYFK